MRVMSGIYLVDNSGIVMMVMDSRNGMMYNSGMMVDISMVDIRMMVNQTSTVMNQTGMMMEITVMNNTGSMVV